MSTDPIPDLSHLTRSERMGRVAELMVMIRADCEEEAMALDGKPFVAGTVARQFGALLAEVSAVAAAVEVLAKEISDE